jgi:hypothetical protein
MTRQQRRYNERQMKKEERKVKKGLKPVSLHSIEESKRSELDTLLFGFYYKDDKDDGFNFVVNDGNPELLQHMLSMFETVQQCFDETHHMVSVDVVESNLKDGIRFWNDFQNCHDRNPHINYKIRIDLSNKQLVESLFFIMYGVYHLVQLGVIKDDNFNGFHFVKTYRKVG